MDTMKRNGLLLLFLALALAASAEQVKPVQPGGKLPLFDLDGQAVDKAVVRTCLARGWAEPWFSNPLKLLSMPLRMFRRLPELAVARLVLSWINLPSR